MQGNAVTLIESFRIETPDSLIRGRASEVRQNVPQRIELTSATLGRSRFAGEVRPPATRLGGQWAISLRGPVLDMAPALAAHETPDKPLEEGAAARIDARFDRVLLPQGIGVQMLLQVLLLLVVFASFFSSVLLSITSFARSWVNSCWLSQPARLKVMMPARRAATCGLCRLAPGRSPITFWLWVS